MSMYLTIPYWLPFKIHLFPTGEIAFGLIPTIIATSLPDSHFCWPCIGRLWQFKFIDHNIVSLTRASRSDITYPNVVDTIANKYFTLLQFYSKRPFQFAQFFVSLLVSLVNVRIQGLCVTLHKGQEYRTTLLVCSYFITDFLPVHL